MRCFREITSRLFQRWLPPPREDEDTARLFAAVFCSSRAVQRFLEMDAAVFARLAANLWSAEGLAAYPHVHQDLHEALRLLAARVSARGTSRAVRQRSATQAVEQSPSYALVFATEKFIECEHSAARVTVRTSAGSNGSTRSTLAGESSRLSASIWKTPA